MTNQPMDAFPESNLKKTPSNNIKDLVSGNIDESVKSPASTTMNIILNNNENIYYEPSKIVELYSDDELPGDLKNFLILNKLKVHVPEDYNLWLILFYKAYNIINFDRLKTDKEFEVFEKQRVYIKIPFLEIGYIKSTLNKSTKNDDLDLNVLFKNAVDFIK